MTPLWTSRDALMATQGRAIGDWQAYDVTIDSRDVRPGDLFVALRGERTDGHRYVADALKAGAVAALVDTDDLGLRGEVPLLVVPDTLKALENLAALARSRSQALRIGVTGSVGKTGTKEALKAAFERQGRTHASVKSFNNHIGVPLTLARLPQKADYAVLEMGMNHPGELSALSALAKPDIAVITTIQPAHMAFFDSLDAIADAKAEIFNGMGREGIAILNRDIPQFARLKARAERQGLGRIVSFGESEGADVRLLRSKLGDSCSCVTADIEGQIMMYKVGLPGRHWVMNSLAVLSAVHAASGDLSLAALALAAMTPLGGRGQQLRLSWQGGALTLIDDSYNASPAAMAASLAVLAQATPERRGRRVAILGDMLELGEKAAHYHQALAPVLREAGVDLVFTVGKEMRALADILPPHVHAGHVATAGDILPLLKRSLAADDIVLVKGSNGVGLAAVVEGLKALNSPSLLSTPEADTRHAL
jgi:UDP-N-acetylmuramoyl-tripeptide--D-alanyl-D-alanine ligase